MNDAVKQHDGPHEDRPSELPALLVAGGSCSQRCRPPRVIEGQSRLTTPQFHDDTSRQLWSAD